MGSSFLWTLTLVGFLDQTFPYKERSNLSPPKRTDIWPHPFNNVMWPAMELVQHQKTSPQEAGQDHQRGTLWTHTSVQTSCLTASKGPSRGLRHGCANCRCPCAHFPTPTPPVFITCCDITACKQSAGSGLCVHYNINWTKRFSLWRMSVISWKFRFSSNKSLLYFTLNRLVICQKTNASAKSAEI